MLRERKQHQDFPNRGKMLARPKVVRVRKALGRSLLPMHHCKLVDLVFSLP